MPPPNVWRNPLSPATPAAVTSPTTLVWFRQDLRLADNPALAAAARRGAVVPVYIWAPEEEGKWPPGGATKWWLDHSLASLARQLEEVGSRLVVRRGPALEALSALVAETSATAVTWNRRYEPAIIERDTQVRAALIAAGVQVDSFNGSLLHEPWTIRTKEGKPYQVFTPFWKACQATKTDHVPLAAPAQLGSPRKWPTTLPLDELELLPKIPWDRGFYATWRVGAPVAEGRLAAFVESGLADYKEARNRVDVDGFSRMSPHLHFGEISPRQIWAAVAPLVSKPSLKIGATHYLSELGWREFAYHLLFHFPQTTTQPLRQPFRKFAWSRSRNRLRRWQRGETGYPIIDAAMRDLWATGFMPNRARMIVASFLTKDLLIPWQRGAEWFWDTLVDADLASNTLGWQWSAGCGADAAPYFRIFNPVSQGEKFDPGGAYVRRWIPELARLPDRWIHQPWKAPAGVLADAGVALGVDYPRPLVDHYAAREEALAAFARIRGG